MDNLPVILTFILSAAAVGVLIGLSFWAGQRSGIGGVTKVLDAANHDAALLNAIEGATKSVPPEIANAIIQVLGVGGALVPNEELKALLTELKTLVGQVTDGKPNTTVTSTSTPTVINAPGG